MICGLYSPLVKIFMPFHFVYKKEEKIKVTSQDLVNNPSRIFAKDEQDFEITITRSCNADTFRHRRPRDIKDELLFKHLCVKPEEGVNEYSQFGIVAVELQNDTFSDLLVSMDGEEEEIRKRKKQEISDAKSVAEKDSHDKVILAIRQLLERVQRERERLNELGNKTYMPSHSELLAAFILKEETQKIAAEQKAIMENFEQSMSKVFAK